jgi:hypothetical protein
MDLCQWQLLQQPVDSGFQSLELFMDEAGFIQDRIMLPLFTYIWAEENPHATF